MYGIVLMICMVLYEMFYMMLYMGFHARCFDMYKWLNGTEHMYAVTTTCT
jgi:hypothetical protein